MSRYVRSAGAPTEPSSATSILPMAGTLLRRLGQQRLEVDLVALLSEQVPGVVARPLVERAVPAQLEVVAVRVGDVDRQVRAVVGGLAQRPAGLAQAAQRIGQRRPA